MGSTREMTQANPTSIPITPMVSLPAASRNIPITTGRQPTPSAPPAAASAGAEISAPFNRQPGGGAPPPSLTPNRSSSTSSTTSPSALVNKLSKQRQQSGTGDQVQAQARALPPPGLASTNEEEEEKERESMTVFREEFDDCDKPVVPERPTVATAPEDEDSSQTSNTSGTGLLGSFFSAISGRTAADIAREEAEQRRQMQRYQHHQRAKAILVEHGIDRIIYGIEERDRTIATLEGHLNRLGKNLKQAEEREKMLSSDLEKVGNELGEAQKELSGSRGFVESEDRGDVGDVKESLGRISGRVDDLAVRLVSELINLPGWEDKTLDNQVVALILSKVNSHSGLVGLVTELGRFERTVEDYLFYGASTVVCSVLMESIFSVFKPGLDLGEEKWVKGVWERVRSAETQDRSARWRSITYLRLPPPPTDLASQISSQILLTLSEFLSPFQTFGPNEFGKWETEFKDLVNKALEWKEVTMKGFLSWDYEAVLGLPSSSGLVENGGGEASRGKSLKEQKIRQKEKERVEGEKLIAIQGFGLVQSRMVVAPAGGGGVVEERVILNPVPGIRVRDLRES